MMKLPAARPLGRVTEAVTDVEPFVTVNVPDGAVAIAVALLLVGPK